MEKDANGQYDQYVPPPASAPSYDEAMKCAPNPYNPMTSYPNLGGMESAALSQTVMPMPTQMPVAMPQPLMQQMAPPATPQMPSYVQSRQFIQPHNKNCDGFFSIPFIFCSLHHTAAVTVQGVSVLCSSCTMPLRTRIDYTTTGSTHCAFLLCCLFGWDSNHSVHEMFQFHNHFRFVCLFSISVTVWFVVHHAFIVRNAAVNRDSSVQIVMHPFDAIISSDVSFFLPNLRCGWIKNRPSKKWPSDNLQRGKFQLQQFFFRFHCVLKF